MLTKLIDSASFFPEDEPQVTVIDPGRSAGLIKAAADSRITTFVEDKLQPKAGHIYLHINAMGSGEFYGGNKNGDYFPEHNLLDYYKTFETSPAHVFRHHINKDPAKAIGKVIFAIYNDRMRRVELIAEVDEQLGQDIEEKMARREYPLTSMACKTPYDICSICGNKARTRQEYCSHLNTELNTIRPDGKKVMAINSGPLRFFDISIVIRPADITSSVLEKVAFAQNQPAISSAEIAEEEGLADMGMDKEAAQIKEATLKKMADLVKVIDDGEVVDSSGNLQAILEKVQDPNHSLIATLSKFEWNDILNTLAEAGVNPSIHFMCELVIQKFLGEKGEGLGEVISELLLRVHPSDIPESSVDLLPTITNAPSNPILRATISRILETSSLSERYVEKRASYGYANWNGAMDNKPILLRGPTLTDEELQFQMQQRGLAPNGPQAMLGNSGILTSLLAMGGVAVAARFYISSLMDKKFEEMQKNIILGNQAKLGIVKSAEATLSDAGLAWVFANTHKSGTLLKSAEVFAGKAKENEIKDVSKSPATSMGVSTALLTVPNTKVQSAGRILTIARKLNHSDD